LQAHPEIEVLDQCRNGFEAVKKAGELKPDLIFLDIQMPKLDGFEVMQLIDPSIAVIFATAFDQYALRAFDANAVDYLLKPFGEERLRSAISKLMRAGASRTGPSAIELAKAARPPREFAQRIVVKDGAKVHVIPADRLDFAEAQDDYVSLRSERKNYLKQQTIASLEETLDPARFIRIHRSYIVNLERVAQIEPYAKDSRIAILTDGSRLPVSRAGYARLKSLLGE
jgi:two-component system LytT family response regulator